MVGQVFFSGECFGAEGTFVGRFSRVKVDVVREVLLTRERLRTERTLERSLARVLSASNILIAIIP